MMPSAYRLANDAYVCLAEDLLVFSDIRHDRYSCLNRSNTQAALRVFPYFPRQGNTRLSEAPAADHEQTRLVLRALVSKGLLADSETVGKAFAAVHVPVPTCSLLAGKPSSIPRSHPGHWASFLKASLKASAKLRLQSLERTVRGVEYRRLRRTNSSSQDHDTLCELAAIFHHLRPYYVREYLCRFDSLALIEFLAGYCQFPDWIFGVRSEPFGAHCWVQENDWVLNDSVEYVSQFTPIMIF